MKKLKVLIIDDNQANLDAAKLQLPEYEVTTCSDFREAHRILGRNDSSDHYIYWCDGLPEYDVVLTDLFMPASSDGQSRFEHSGQEMPYGLVFALGAIRRGTPKVAIVTKGSHHSSPLLWALDLIGLGWNGGEPFKIGETTFSVGNDASNVKNWKVVLDKLMSV